ncbi:MAG: hypothetical protein JSV85_05360 [Candidatus Bathyarchaeota archaeon]|nr:MAG: hypothetical protein JSV85_05360 [Candidatus Bathyarchaeota archaeon]
MFEIDQILVLLKDGSWHKLNEIAKQSRLQQAELDAIVGFLEENEFVCIDKENQKARLTSPALRFLMKTST